MLVAVVRILRHSQICSGLLMLLLLATAEEVGASHQHQYHHHGGQEGVRVILEELDRGGAQVGLHEAEWGELEVHDGVWVQTH